MQRWEYCTLWRRGGTPARLYLTVYRAEGPLDRELRPDERAGERSLRDVWARTLARLGREGWELVAANGAGFHFKRPAPAGGAVRGRTAVLGDTDTLPTATLEARAGEAAGQIRGRIAWLQTERGFGFIAPDQGDQPVGFLASAVEGRTFEVLRTGQLVEYVEGVDPRNPARQRAERVRVLAE